MRTREGDNLFQRDHRDPHADPARPLEVDRQRVVHSAAFRRLQHKTQVFVAPQSDHFRSRLTHTLEVAHLSRVIAARLGLNAELCEVAALAHDLGHPPFGHAGERALDVCLRAHGGFEHNQHTLRVVETLEHPYPEFRGLNLTRAVRACIASHQTPYDRPGAPPQLSAAPPLPESLAVDLADRIAYALHDIQDGLYAGLLRLDHLKGVALWEAAYDGPAGDPDAWRGRLRPAIDRMQRRLIDDIARASQPASAIVRLSDEQEANIDALDACLRANVYHSALLRHSDEHARLILTSLFEALSERTELLPRRFRERLGQQPAERVVADYLAGMTDRYCMDEYERVLG